MKKLKILLLSALAVLAVGLIAGCNQITKPDGSSEHEHTMMYIPAEAASCIKEGNEAYFQCLGCGKTFSDLEGENEFDDYIIEKTAHTIGSSSITKQPTLDEDGELSGSCSKCGTSITQPIDKLTVTELKITSPPTKTEYIEGEQFNLAGLTVTAVLSNNTELTVDDFGISTTVLSVGDTYVTISWRGKTVDVEITVTTSTTLPEIERLELVTPPDKVQYFDGEAFDGKGMVIKAVYSDLTEQEISGYTVDKTVLVTGDTFVTVSYSGKTVIVPVSVAEVLNVSELYYSSAETEYAIRGVYIGIAEEGPTADREMLLKDIQNDDMIAMRNVPYGTFPDYGYNYGDELRIFATLKIDETSSTPNKLYLDFSEKNGELSDTVTGHTEINYLFNNVYEINNQSDMQSFFSVHGSFKYAYVKLSGVIYFNSYTGSDGVSVYRIHMNSSATAISAIKPDGVRTVSLRSNVMNQNLGANWDSFLDLSNPYPSYPGIPFNGTITAVYTGANSAYFQLTILDISFIDNNAETPDPSSFTNAEAVTEIAYAFYRRGTQIQYDQTQSRRNINPSPEDSSENKTLYLDCSSYVNACFYEAFGENVMPYTVTAKTPNTANYTAYAKDNPDNADVIGYWENADYTTTSAIKAILQQVRNMLQTGDVLVYRHGASSGTSGHVYIYVGNDTFLHCTGSSYNYQSDPLNSTDKATTIEKTYGAIQTISSYSIFEDTSNNRYLFKKTSTDSIYNFSLLRPLAREMTPTENTEARMLLRGLEVYKYNSKGLYSAAAKQVTFQISITNNSSSNYGQLVISEIIPEGLIYSDYHCPNSCTVSYNSNKVTITLPSLNIGMTASVSLTFNISDSYRSKTIVFENTTSVNSFTVNNKIIHTAPYLPFATETAITEKANEYIASSTTFTNPVKMVSQLYSECGYELFSYSTVSAALSDIIDSGANTYRTDTEISQMLVPCLYGGLDIKSGYIKDNDRVRMVKETYLSTGDIILAEYSSSSVAYVYLGNSKLLAVYSGTKTAQSVTISNDAYTNILVTLISYDRYAVLRPSMVI